ncbi:unnamed protein product [Cercopithifilaria johnstoni]|uniref:Fork-head domain-containing protein n=1 Tax=Cercopithifilaria johnstoni TaxID=2874296 RepID=A0A8J2Q456_9BILA|nr:unnamed protein product [Cercopithifilaria johnstoni]
MPVLFCWKNTTINLKLCSLCDSVEKLSNGRLGTSSTVALMGSPESGSFSPGISSPVPCGTSSTGPIGIPSDASDSGIAVPSKKSTTRRNAWGNMSYADLITQAIVSSPEKRLTLSQVYEWMVQNVPYFRDKGDSNSSAGWKGVTDLNDTATNTATLYSCQFGKGRSLTIRSTAVGILTHMTAQKCNRR